MHYQKKIGVYISHRGHLLLIREKTDGNRDYHWNIVKGAFEAKDTSLLQTVQRECREEVGLQVKIVRVLNISYRRRRMNPVMQINYCVESTSGRPKLASKKKQQVLNEDIIEAKFFTHQELLSIPCRELTNIRVWRGIRRWIRQNNTSGTL